jgi:hypothetical protein
LWPAFVQRSGHHRETQPERSRRAAGSARHPGHADRVACDARRRSGLVFDTAAGAVRDQELVVELGLRRPRFPWLARLEEHRDLVLVAILVAGLDADDEGDRLPVVGRRRGEIGRRFAGVVGRELAGDRGFVLVRVGRRRIALRVAGVAVLAQPRVHLGTGEHGPADRMIDDRDLTAQRTGRFDLEHVRAECQSRYQTLVDLVWSHGERARDVTPCRCHLYRSG